jgi:Trk K+ transport system NAD-binding subunit
MIDENIDPRMAIAQVLRELSAEDADVFMAKISSAEDNVDAYNICMNTMMEVSR